MTFLEVTGLSAGYEDYEVVHDVGFAVREAGFVLLVGGNGSGKSTLLNALVGLAWVSGATRVRYRDAPTSLPLRGRPGPAVAMVPQAQGVFDTLSVQENLDLAAGSVKAEAAARPRSFAFRLLAEAAVGLDMPAALLSGGQRQTLAILLGVVRNPEFLLLDEPLAGLDLRGVERVAFLLETVRRELAPAMLVVEHRWPALLPMCDTLVALRDGRLADVIENPNELDFAVIRRRIDEAFFG